MTWNPDMSAAPRDGTEFQTWLKGPDGLTSWEPRSRFNEDEAFQIWTRVDYDEDGWDYIRGDWRPIAWMPQPLPPPPQEAPHD